MQLEIDDTGKERRNALIVSAALVSAALLQLEMPSFLAEIIKFKIDSAHAYRIWLLACVLAVYVLMRYNFSDSRIDASTAGKVAFARALVTDKRHIFSDRPVEGAQAYGNYMSQISRSTQSLTGEVQSYLGPRHFEVVGYRLSWRKIMFRWRIKPDFVGLYEQEFRLLNTDITTDREIGRISTLYYALLRTWHKHVWGKSAIEISTVYAAAIAAIVLCLLRAYELYPWSTIP